MNHEGTKDTKKRKRKKTDRNSCAALGRAGEYSPPSFFFFVPFVPSWLTFSIGHSMTERHHGTGEFDPVSKRILGLAITVHRRLGPGLLESAYEECLAYELHNNGIEFKRQVAMPIIYDEIELECGYRLDLLVENTVIVELKAVERLLPLHEAQMLT